MPRTKKSRLEAQGEAPESRTEVAMDVLGLAGAMLSGSKQGPASIYWNACIFDKDEQQIWHGDLDTEKKADDLQELANRIGTIYVTPEQPFRFKGLRAGRAESYAPGRILTYSPKN